MKIFHCLIIGLVMLMWSWTPSYGTGWPGLEPDEVVQPKIYQLYNQLNWSPLPYCDTNIDCEMTAWIGIVTPGYYQVTVTVELNDVIIHQVTEEMLFAWRGFHAVYFQWKPPVDGAGNGKYTIKIKGLGKPMSIWFDVVD